MLKINKNEYQDFKNKTQNYDNIISNFQNQLNIYSHELAKYKSIVQQMANVIKPITLYNEPKSIIKCVQDAYLSESTKENTLILVNKYIGFCILQ